MTDMVVQKNIAAVAKAVTSVRPQSQAGDATINGASIDRLAHGNALSAILTTQVGAVSGAPTSFSVTHKVQDSADDSTFADYKPDGVNVATGAAVAAANTDDNTAVSLSSARRWVRVVSTVAFTGGTSPAVLVAGGLVLAGEDRLAAS